MTKPDGVKPRTPKTWRQPSRPVVSRERRGGTTWALLACGHEETATGLDLSTELRCSECNPVRRDDAPTPAGDPWA